MPATQPVLVPLVVPRPDHAGAPVAAEAETETVFDIESLDLFYGSFRALQDVTLTVPANRITALIGPSGCGKTTFLRCLNRMTDLVPGARVVGQVRYRGTSLYDGAVDPIELRRRVGMVFQKPNPFPKSIYDNVAFGPRVNGMRVGKMDDLVEQCLRDAALWDEVKDKLEQSALSLSGGQQQRLCIARTIAVKPDVILMDEPCSALDPVATMRIEDLMMGLKDDYTIVIVTHNMQQAARISDAVGFFTVEVDDQGERTGVLVEVAPANELFRSPRDQRTEDYITGRFG
jgi:phosphate transport system ATP-binding protein